ncbi:MAG: N-acetylmannosamine-6-phosphate 2-epimerase [Bryobacteraceae bacterium]|nr:N-acetylmannosamine-6-phosphate 2-epimerase [Bryobacteraceae bacterium]
MHAALESLRGGLVVSCQAEGDDPFNQPQYVALFARAAEMGGARGIRACGAANIRAIREATPLPIVGITKSQYPDGSVLITGDFGDVHEALEAGAAIIALDATGRIRPNGMRGPEFVARVKAEVGVPLLADVSTFEEGMRALEAGADAVATTLSGYTPDTRGRAGGQPDWDLLRALAGATSLPVILEGGVWTPEEARRGLRLGAHAVVVGTAITRPRLVTRAFMERMGS